MQGGYGQSAREPAECGAGLGRGGRWVCSTSPRNVTRGRQPNPNTHRVPHRTSDQPPTPAFPHQKTFNVCTIWRVMGARGHRAAASHPPAQRVKGEGAWGSRFLFVCLFSSVLPVGKWHFGGRVLVAWGADASAHRTANRYCTSCSSPTQGSGGRTWGL